MTISFEKEVTVDVDVTVDLDEIEMIEVLRANGWIVTPEDDYMENPFTDDEMKLMIRIIEEKGYTVGSELYQMREILVGALK